MALVFYMNFCSMQLCALSLKKVLMCYLELIISINTSDTVCVTEKEGQEK